MSFVDLMANDVWSEADITRRTESMIRAEFSAEAETILNRKVSGMVLGIYAPTEAEQIEMGRYQMAVEAARVAGQEARADMALLAAVMGMEQARRRLDQPVLSDDLSDADTLAQDATERAAAQAVIDAAAPEVLALFDARNPRADGGSPDSPHVMDG